MWDCFVSLLSTYLSHLRKPNTTINIPYTKHILIGEKKKISLQEILPYIRTGCLICPDYTGIFSDISAGLSENYPGYTVLIIRDEKAQKLVKEASEKGYLELIKAKTDVIEEVETKAGGKIVRAMRYMSILL